MNVLLSTNNRESKGLLRDAYVLAQLLDELGHSAMVVDFRDGFAVHCDLMIHLEVVVPELLDVAPHQWWIPNPEWAKPEYLKYIDRFECVLCKTRDTERIFSSLHPRVVRAGFMTEDHYDPSVVRCRSFFHAAGGNIAKGTDTILEAWKGLDRKLLRISGGETDEIHSYYQNENLFHLCPSWYEGWGHAEHQCLSVGGILVTTNAPPMNEIGAAKLIEPVAYGQQQLARIAYVDAKGIRDAAKWCLDLDSATIKQLSEAARTAYLEECNAFRCVFKDLVNNV
jgi:hypothetical protein